MGDGATSIMAGTSRLLREMAKLAKGLVGSIRSVPKWHGIRSLVTFRSTLRELGLGLQSVSWGHGILLGHPSITLRRLV